MDCKALRVTHLERVDLFVREVAVHMAVHDAVALALALGLWVAELVHNRHLEMQQINHSQPVWTHISYRQMSSLRYHNLATYLLDQVASDVAHDLAEIVLVEVVAVPKAHVLVALGVLAVGLELRDLAVLELRDEALVL